MARINGEDIVKVVWEDDRNMGGVTKAQVAAIVKLTLKAIKDNLHEGNEVSFKGFGTFHVDETKARTGRNPNTGAPMKIEAGRRVRFSTGKNLKLNGSK